MKTIKEISNDPLFRLIHDTIIIGEANLDKVYDNHVELYEKIGKEYVSMSEPVPNKVAREKCGVCNGIGEVLIHNKKWKELTLCPKCKYGYTTRQAIIADLFSGVEVIDEKN